MPRLTQISKLVVLLLLLCTQFSFSQSQEYKFRHITPKEGLSSNHVQCIAKDSRGFMWFGTTGRLNRVKYKFEY
ncbi:MAG: hypothetical protein ISR57_09970 [Bacteroidales bacterium]|nr:hypothetical protein [Bacteroidota bacterium]MBL6950956.1 hypothetical protein [Bacteroidales bacterium]